MAHESFQLACALGLLRIVFEQLLRGWRDRCRAAVSACPIAGDEDVAARDDVAAGAGLGVLERGEGPLESETNVLRVAHPAGSRIQRLYLDQGYPSRSADYGYSVTPIAQPRRTSAIKLSLRAGVSLTGCSGWRGRS